jgi:hypothetical protein
MHSIALLAVVSLASILGTTNSDENATPSPGLPPWFMTVGKVNLETKTLVLHIRTLHVVANDVPNGETIAGKTITERVNHRIYETRTSTVSLESATFTDAGGTKIDSADLAKRLEVGTAVVVSADGKEIDPAYLKALAKDTVVIIDCRSAQPTAKSGVLFPPSVDYQAPPLHLSR